MLVPRPILSSVSGSDEFAPRDAIPDASTAAALFPRVRGTRPAPRSPSEYVMATFVANYRAEYADEDPTTAAFSAHAYDAAWLARVRPNPAHDADEREVEAVGRNAGKRMLEYVRAPVRTETKLTSVRA